MYQPPPIIINKLQCILRKTKKLPVTILRLEPTRQARYYSNSQAKPSVDFVGPISRPRLHLDLKFGLRLKSWLSSVVIGYTYCTQHIFILLHGENISDFCKRASLVPTVESETQSPNVCCVSKHLKLLISMLIFNCHVLIYLFKFQTKRTVAQIRTDPSTSFHPPI